MGADDRPTEVWTFAGERVGSDGKKRVHVWIDESGRDLWFAAKSGRTIGGRYRVTIKRTPPDGVSLFETPAPEYLDRDLTHEQLSVWQAADTAAKVRQAGRRREARDAAAETRLDEALALIKRVAMKQRTSADRAAFIGHVIEQISKVW